MVELEGVVLALMGMRPVGKAFTTSFLVNMAAIATAFVMWVIVLALNASEVVLVLAVIVIPTAVQGIVLMVNRGELGKGRAWLAAVAMKLCSMLLLIGVIKLLDL